MSSNDNFRLAKDIDISEGKIKQDLGIISSGLSVIESQLTRIETTLLTNGEKIEKNKDRIQDSAVWQASFGDRASLDKSLENIQKEIMSMKKQVSSLETIKNVSVGQKDVGKEVLKWAVGILGAVIVAHKYKFWGG